MKKRYYVALVPLMATQLTQPMHMLFKRALLCPLSSIGTHSATILKQQAAFSNVTLQQQNLYNSLAAKKWHTYVAGSATSLCPLSLLGTCLSSGPDAPILTSLLGLVATLTFFPSMLGAIYVLESKSIKY